MCVYDQEETDHVQSEHAYMEELLVLQVLIVVFQNVHDASGIQRICRHVHRENVRHRTDQIPNAMSTNFVVIVRVANPSSFPSIFAVSDKRHTLGAEVRCGYPPTKESRQPPRSIKFVPVVDRFVHYVDDVRIYVMSREWSMITVYIDEPGQFERIRVFVETDKVFEVTSNDGEFVDEFIHSYVYDHFTHRSECRKTELATIKIFLIDH